MIGAYKDELGAKYTNMDIVDLKELVEFGAISFYVKESVIYCTNKIGEVVKVGIVDETGNNNH